MWWIVELGHVHPGEFVLVGINEQVGKAIAEQQKFPKIGHDGIDIRKLSEREA